MGFLRLDKFLADAGRGTRSEVKRLIKYGRVKIGGKVVRKPEEKVDTDKDSVFVDGQPVCYSEFEYYMLNKPAGVVSAVTDKKNKTVVQLIDTEKRRDLFPVGRLDKDTEGLVIITNDGKLANELLAPNKHVEKTYYAVVRGAVTDDIILQFQEGLDIGDDRRTKPAGLKVVQSVISEGAGVNLDKDAMGSDKLCSVEITITEGRFHQIKRMFQAVGMEVVYLKRLSMGGLALDAALPCGAWRRLREDELLLLKARQE
ncbi:MAG: rRNA pseudouridine synthase [Clostridium sp.]|nr:rRNA pseudouridine synthase [Clostridium sp.]